jgi:hypothetical protein
MMFSIRQLGLVAVLEGPYYSRVRAARSRARACTPSGCRID